MDRQHTQQIIPVWIVGIIMSTTLFLSCEPMAVETHDPAAAAAKIVYGILKVDHLRCEYINDPLAIDIPDPRLNWRILPVASQLHDLKQQAYQVVVASEPNKLEPEAADLWDSGKIVSEQCTHVRYGGSALTTRQRCYWRVRVWDHSDLPSPWSPTQQWRMGMLNSEDWDPAEWIGLTEDTHESPLRSRPFQTQDMNEPDARSTFASPLLRRDFQIRKPVHAALATVAGLGYHELYINGSRIGDHVLDPGQTSYDVHALYVTHDITDALSGGANTVGLWLGNGFYGQNIGFGRGLVYGAPCVRAQIWIEYEDGTTERIVTNTDWHTHVGPILFDNVYAGETYDARLEQVGWDRPGFPAAGWRAAKVLEAPTQRLDPQQLPPIRKIQSLKPASIKQGADGRWIVDLGQNIAGWLRISVTETEGTQVTITYGEHLTPDGSAVDTESTGHFATGVIQQDIYVCKGEGPETWEPRFTYQGFRYAEISGLTEMPTSKSVQGVLVHSDVPSRGSFSCSEPLLNQMVEVSKWTIVDNLHSIPEDCPHREKCGWTGDAHLMAETAIYHYDMAQFFVKYLVDIEGVLGRGGKQYIKRTPTKALIPPMVAPGKRLNLESTADWGVAIVLIPWYLQVYYGDEAIVERCYPHMKTWATYEWGFVEDGLLKHGLGDWCPPLWDRKTNPDAMECKPDISATLFYLEALRILSIMAGQQGDGAFAVWCQEKSGLLSREFNEKTLQAVEQTNAWSYGSQTANALALKFNIVPENKAKDVLNGLRWDIEARHQGHHACGVFGLKHLYTTLAERGQPDLAYSVLTNPTFPSHTYILGCGMTTWPERQFPMAANEPYGARSYNHPFHSGFATFFHEIVSGIRPDPEQPGFKHIILKPVPLSQITWAKAEHECLYGVIKSGWRIKDHAFIWDIEIPANCSATVHVPGIQVVAPDGATPVDMKGGYVVFEMGSGRYTFTSK